MEFMPKKDKAKFRAIISKCLGELYGDKVEMREHEAQSFVAVDFCMRGEGGKVFRIAAGRSMYLNDMGIKT